MAKRPKNVEIRAARIEQSAAKREVKPEQRCTNCAGKCKCNSQTASAPAQIDVRAAYENLMRTVAEFKQKNDERLTALERGQVDPLTQEEVNRINAAITEAQYQLQQRSNAPTERRENGAPVSMPGSDECAMLMSQMQALNCGPQMPPMAVPALDVLASRQTLTRRENPRAPRYASPGNVLEQRRAQIRHEYRSAFSQYMRRGDDSNLRNLERRAAAIGSNPEGGYLTAPEVDREITRILSEISPIRQIATVREISTHTFEKPWSNGGATSGWVGEVTARTETQTPTIAMLQFPVMELYAMPSASQSLLDDSYLDIEQWLADEVNIEFAEQEGAAFVNGNGINQPRGFLSYDTVADASWVDGKLGYIATGVAADILDTADLDPNGVDALYNLIYSIKQGYRAGATFVMNRATVAAFRKLKDKQGQYLWQPAVAAAEPSTLVGYPITEAEDMPDIAANTFPLAFGDFRRGYIVVDRIGTRVLRDPYSAKPFVQFYTTKRVGGGVQNYEAIKLLKVATS